MEGEKECPPGLAKIVRRINTFTFPLRIATLENDPGLSHENSVLLG
jgi:hypothetical protein